MTTLVTWAITIGCGFIAIFMIYAIMREGIEWTCGRNGNIIALIGKVMFLILIIGIVFFAQNIKEFNKSSVLALDSTSSTTTVTENVSNGENVVDNVTYETTQPNTSYYVESTLVEGTAPIENSAKSIEKQWNQAVHDEYSFYFKNKYGKTSKVQPQYYDYTKYNVEFDHDSQIVYISDK